MKIYIGNRADNKASVWFMDTEEAATPYPLPPRTDIVNHSPDGFEWGYGGSGPAQLALALLVDLYGNTPKVRVQYLEFKREVIAFLPSAGWVLTEEEIRRFMERKNQTGGQTA